MNYFNDKQTNTVDINRYGSVIADSPSSKVSDKYKFIPTTQALAVLADHGWFPVNVKQANTRIIENQGFQKHVIRLSNENFNRELSVNDTIPQLMLINSHSGTSAFSLSAALYRKICANGLCVSESTLGSVRIRHLGYQDQSMSDACENIVKALPSVLNTVELFKSVNLNKDEQRALATAAIEMRFDGEKYAVEPDQVLRTRRYADNSSDLWTTYNVIQENVIKGGVRQLTADNRRIRSREVKSIDENVKLNKALWTLTSEMAKLKAA